MEIFLKGLVLSALAASLSIGLGIAPTSAQAADPDRRAADTESKMTTDERTVLTIGALSASFAGKAPPAGAIPGAGYIEGIPRLGVPALRETDASLGVAYANGARHDGATALPSGMAMASSFNASLIEAGGAMMAAEARAKGFNVMLAGGINLMRDPRNGRTFEYLGEDPLLAGLLGAAQVRGVQSQNVISTIKHFALNGQETGRKIADVKISDAAARESDLLAFEIAIEKGRPGAVMCAYNLVAGAHACESDYLLNHVLKRDWGYKGFVMSDWGAVSSVDAALSGLDQQSGAQLDPSAFFSEQLAAKAVVDPQFSARIKDMNRRILRSIYAVGAQKFKPSPESIDVAKNAQVAEAIEQEGLVLLRNEASALPLSATVRKIAIIGGYADMGVLSGGGSSQVQGQDGPAVSIPLGDYGRFSRFLLESYQRSVPIKSLRARSPQTVFVFRDGRYIKDAVDAARQSDVAIIFATQWMTEGLDAPDLSLPRGQDMLIAKVAAVNSQTIVVLETGGPVLMPWLDQTAAVIEAWYPGARGAEAIAAVLYGDVDPSGRLPATFPASVSQLPRPDLPGHDTVEPNFSGSGTPGQNLLVDYDIEGSNVGYRWFATKGSKPLFPFGFGLSYTSFTHGALSLRQGKALVAELAVRNTGTVAGADTPQIYLVSVAGKPVRRLVGFDKVTLRPGEEKTVQIQLEPRVLAQWKDGAWTINAGTYGFAIGTSAENLGPEISAHFPARRWLR
jgi:beta-glucosidase